MYVALCENAKRVAGALRVQKSAVSPELELQAV